MVRKNKWIGNLILIACVTVIAAVVGVTAVGAGYTVLSGDDFTHGVRVGVFHVSLPAYFGASLLYVKDLYMDWQGTFFSMFLQAFLSPINNFGLAQLRAVMVGNVLFFFGSLFALLWAGLSFFQGEGEGVSTESGAKGKTLTLLRLVILTVFFLTIANGDVYSEIWFWYSGAVAYSMPFSFLLAALTLLLLINKEETGRRMKMSYVINKVIFMFLSSGLASDGGLFSAFLQDFRL